MKRRILFALSSHGFGHFSMTAPIINALLTRHNVEVIVRTMSPAHLVQGQLSGPVEVIQSASDFGVKNTSALNVDLVATRRDYQSLHENWPQALDKEKQQLQRIRPDLIVSNIPYLTLAAANELSIPALAYCSLNWADITRSYFANDDTFVQHCIPIMLDAYNSAEVFICPEPSMAMPDLNNVMAVGPVCRLGVNHKKHLRERFGLKDTAKLVLVSAGGVATHIPVDTWPELPGVVWISNQRSRFSRKDILAMDEIALPYPDLAASVDAFVCKPGYGTVVESVCLGLPAIYVCRNDWPEEPALVNWWQKHANIFEITRERFFSGDFGQELLALLKKAPRPPVLPSGIEQTLKIIDHTI